MNNPERLRVSALLVLGLCAMVAGCSANNAESQAPGGEVVARIGEETITVSEVDAHLQRTNPKAYQQIFDAREAALDQMISERLLAAEAQSRGISVQQLQQDVTAGVSAVTDEEIAAFYKQNTARMGGRTLEQMSGQLRTFLTRSKQQEAFGNLLADLRQKASVQVLMEPPRMNVEVAENDPAKGGPEGAPILLVEFSDFQ